MEEKSSTRSNYWCGIFYPSEASGLYWKTNLEALHIKAIVSPLHKPDPDPETHYEKKEHYHVMFMYDSLKSYKQVKLDFWAAFGEYCTEYLVPARSKIGMLKYFCHMNNPGKEKLDPADVTCFGGADYLEEIADDGTALYITLMEITEWIHSNHCCSFVKFLLWCQFNNLEWYRIASTRSSIFVKAVIDSERNWFKDIETEINDESKNSTATTTSREINNQ